MNIYALKNHKVKCTTLSAGYDYHKKIAETYLEIGKEYVVEKTIVDSFHTDVFLQEFPGIKFNSVFFEDVTQQSKESDLLHPDYKRFKKICQI